MGALGGKPSPAEILFIQCMCFVFCCCMESLSMHSGATASPSPPPHSDRKIGFSVEQSVCYFSGKSVKNFSNESSPAHICYYPLPHIRHLAPTIRWVLWTMLPHGNHGAAIDKS